MAPHEGEDDPAVYRASSSKAKNGNTEDSDEEEDEDNTLLTAQPGFNTLLLVLRDQRVLRFVKYVSALAPGSRFDVCGEYEIAMIESDDEE